MTYLHIIFYFVFFYFQLIVQTPTSNASKNAKSKDHVFANDEPLITRIKDVLVSFFPLGFLAFGGPTAYAILYETFVTSKKWLTDERFIELLAVGQGLPGPTATQMVISCGAYRAGIIGGILALLCWTLPSLIVLILAGLGVSEFIEGTPDWMSGLPPAAVSLVFVAAIKLTKKVVNSNLKIGLCLVSSMIVLIINGDSRIHARIIGVIYPILIFGGGLVTLIDSKISSRAHLYNDMRNNGNNKKQQSKSSNFKTKTTTTTRNESNESDENIDSIKPENEKEQEKESLTTNANETRNEESGKNNATSKSVNTEFTVNVDISRKSSVVLLIIWLVTLIVFIILRSEGSLNDNNLHIWKLFESFFRIGSIVYGGGQVILPMLLSEVVDPGWVTEDQFWQGFALTQALPGPLSNFAAFLGAVAFGFKGGIIGWIGLFGPGLLLIFAFLPLWAYIHKWEWFRIFLQGVNASAIGLVIAACEMLWKSAVSNYAQASVAIFTATLVILFDVSASVAIVAGGVLGFLFSNTVFGIGLDDICQM